MDGQRAPEYGLVQKGANATVYIESRESAAFVVRLASPKLALQPGQVHMRNGPLQMQAISLCVLTDGNDNGGGALCRPCGAATYFDGPMHVRSHYRIDRCSDAQGRLHPFRFASLKMTDDDSLVTATEASVKAAGIIRAELWRCSSNGPSTYIGTDPSAAVTMHESSKKCAVF